MNTSIAQILSEPTRRWDRRQGASAQEVAGLLAMSPYPVPLLLVELLQYSNGGEGELSLPPLFFVLDSTAVIAAGLHDDFLNEQFPGFFFFGGNGGMERIALDFRSDTPPFPVVMIDPIAGPDSAEEIARDFSTFVAAIGLECRDDVEGGP